MCTGGVTSPPTSDCYITVPPALPKASPAAQNVCPAPRPRNPRLAARLVCWYGSILIILFALLMLVMAKVPECEPHVTVESLSSSPSSPAAVTWGVGFSISDNKTYENRTMKATLFNGNVPVSDPTTLGPVVLNASATVATFTIPDATWLRARYLTPCTTVSNLTAKLEIEERVPLVKSRRRLMIVCENVVVLLPSNGSCYSSSPPALLGRASCRNDSSDLQGILFMTLMYIMIFVFFVFLGHFALGVLF